MQRTQRTLTSANVAATLSKAGIPALGANKLTMLSRTGNQYTRESDGTATRIFNVLAFRDKTAQDAAVTAWKAGTSLEKANDIEGAQEHYKAAYNKLMSFSVLEENAPAFENLFEVAGIIESVPAGKELQAAGTLTVIGFNRPRPVAVVSNMTSSAALFVIEEPDTTPVTAKSKLAKTAKK